MSFAALLLFAMQAAPTAAVGRPAVPPAVVAPVTPASVTVPTYDVTCKMNDLSGAQFELAFQQTGGRGYRAAALREGAQGMGSTPIITIVKRDTSGRFENLSLWSDVSKPGWPGVKQTKPRPGKLATQFLSFDTMEPGKVLLTLHPRWPLEQVSAFGLCSVTATAQKPMSDTEAVEFFSK